MDLEELKQYVKADGGQDLRWEAALLLIERCEKAEANAIVTDNTKTLNAALERNAELETELFEMKVQITYLNTQLGVANTRAETAEAKLSEMEKQTPIYQWSNVNDVWTDCTYEMYGIMPDGFRRIVYALPVPQQSEWQDISTAPKDKNILLYGAKRLDYCVGRFQSGEWITESSHEWHLMYTPTHWMPLPLPPITK